MTDAPVLDWRTLINTASAPIAPERALALAVRYPVRCRGGCGQPVARVGAYCSARCRADAATVRTLRAATERGRVLNARGQSVRVCATAGCETPRRGYDAQHCAAHGRPAQTSASAGVGNGSPR